MALISGWAFFAGTDRLFGQNFVQNILVGSYLLGAVIYFVIRNLSEQRRTRNRGEIEITNQAEVETTESSTLELADKPKTAARIPRHAVEKSKRRSGFFDINIPTEWLSLIAVLLIFLIFYVFA